MQVYFLCTGNSCRSQMAEGWAKKLLPDWTVASAGIEVHGLNPQAVFAMAQVGIDISQQKSTLIDPDYLVHCDLVVTLCGDARDRCPVTPKTVRHVHWPLPDPAQAQGTPAEQAAVFAQVRDQIRELIQTQFMSV